MGNLSKERFPFPPPNLPLSPPKTFGWWGGYAEGVPLDSRLNANGRNAIKHFSRSHLLNLNRSSYRQYNSVGKA